MACDGSKPLPPGGVGSRHILKMENSWHEIAKAPRSKPSISSTTIMRIQLIRRTLRMAARKSLVRAQSARKRAKHETLIIRASARQEVRARVNSATSPAPGEDRPSAPAANGTARVRAGMQPRSAGAMRLRSSSRARSTPRRSAPSRSRRCRAPSRRGSGRTLPRYRIGCRI